MPSRRSVAPNRCWGRYTHRVAIANSRLVSLSDGKVRFAWKDYRQDSKTKVMTLDADEFIRRFLLHALPVGFHRIRYYGFFANGGRGDNVALCRRLLDAHHAAADSELPTGHAKSDRQSKVCDVLICPDCGGTMRRIAAVPISRSTVIRHDLIAACYRRHRRRACCATCRHPDSSADRLPHSRLQNCPTRQTELLLAPSTRSAGSSLPK
jgi:hypothetical protein